LEIENHYLIMTLLQKLQTDLKEAMKTAQKERVGTLRMVLSAIHNREIEEHTKGAGELTDALVTDVIRREAKKRREAAEIYFKAGRKDLGDKETRELEIIQTYLPRELSEAEIETIVRKMLDKGARDFGAVMKEVLNEVAGRAEAGVVASVIKRLLKQ
jgi:uncharacterized protein YqeY